MWKVTTDADSITLRGMLTEKGLRQLSSFLELPTTKFSTLAKESESKVDPMKATVDASLRYFKTLEKLPAPAPEARVTLYAALIKFDHFE